MSRPFYNLRSFSLVLLVAGCATACSNKTIYSDVYSPGRSRFVPPVERTVATELPPETTTTTTTTTTTIPADGAMLAPSDPVVLPDAAQPAPGLPGMEAAPAVPGLEPVPAAPGMEAAPAVPGMEAAPAPAAPAPGDPAAPAM